MSSYFFFKFYFREHSFSRKFYISLRRYKNIFLYIYFFSAATLLNGVKYITSERIRCRSGSENSVKERRKWLPGLCLRSPSRGRECFVRPRKGVIDLIPREKPWGKAVRREHFAACFPLFVREWDFFVRCLSFLENKYIYNILKQKKRSVHCMRDSLPIDVYNKYCIYYVNNFIIFNNYFINFITFSTKFFLLFSRFISTFCCLSCE